MTQLTAYQKKRAQQLSKSKQFSPIPFKSQNQGSQGSYKGKNRNYYASHSQSQAQGNFQSFCIHQLMLHQLIPIFQCYSSNNCSLSEKKFLY